MSNSPKNEDLTDTVEKKYIALLLEHHEAISNSLFDTDQSMDMSHDIQLKKMDPIFLKQFRIPKAQQEAIQKHIEGLLKLGVVQPSRSKFYNPIYVWKSYTTSGKLTKKPCWRLIQQRI